MTIDGVIQLLHKKKSKLGTWAAVAKDMGVSSPYLSDCLRGRREPGKGILDPLGLIAVVTYRVKEIDYREKAK